MLSIIPALFLTLSLEFNSLAVLGMSIGVAYGLAIMLYYRAMESDDVSRVVPVILMSPVFVLVFAVAFLGEVLTPLNYAGVFLILAGGVAISHKSGRKSKLVSHIFLIALGASFVFAVRNVLTSFVGMGMGIWPMLFWIGIGGGLVSTVLFARHHPHIRRKAETGIEHLILSSVIAKIAFIAFVFAITIGSVTLVSAVNTVQVLFVLVFAILLSKVRPEIIREHINGSIIELKIVSAILIILGLLLIL